jgi:hypothetical protein
MEGRGLGPTGGILSALPAESHKNIKSKDNLCSGRDLNPVTPECNSETLLLE